MPNRTTSQAEENSMIELFTAATPNGHKISVMLEELGAPYTVRPLRLSEKDQKQEAYLKINPNGRIPTIIDHDNRKFPVFESGAILLYLAERFGKFLPTDLKQRSRVIQWLMFQMGGIGPMQGQANVFYRYAPEKIPYAIRRYQKETLRLYRVLERQLEGRGYLVDEVSIADFATFPWVRTYSWSGLSVDDLPNLQRWLKTMAHRPGVVKGLKVPEPVEFTSETATEDRIDAIRRILE